jgi:hypothetical protein
MSEMVVRVKRFLKVRLTLSKNSAKRVLGFKKCISTIGRMVGSFGKVIRAARPVPCTGSFMTSSAVSKKFSKNTIKYLYLQIDNCIMIISFTCIY